jgi:hypothetical protein
MVEKWGFRNFVPHLSKGIEITLLIQNWVKVKSHGHFEEIYMEI